MGKQKEGISGVPKLVAADEGQEKGGDRKAAEGEEVGVFWGWEHFGD